MAHCVLLGGDRSDIGGEDNREVDVYLILTHRLGGGLKEASCEFNR